MEQLCFQQPLHFGPNLHVFPHWSVLQVNISQPWQQAGRAEPVLSAVASKRQAVAITMRMEAP